MKDIAFHISDITENSIRAGATQIEISLILASDSVLNIEIKDNGCGMSEETLKHISNPFYTTRTTRRIGLGISFLTQSCEQTGGFVQISSILGKGTTLNCCIYLNHIDAPVPGDIGEALALLMSGNPEINFIYKLKGELSLFELSSKEVKSILEDIPISRPEVTIYLTNILKESIKGLLGEITGTFTVSGRE